MTQLVGYARVSTREQHLDSQIEALNRAGATRVFADHAESSRNAKRPQWLACRDYLRPGDVLLVWRLDRLAGSTTMAIETINDLHDHGIDIRSLTEPDIDTTTPMGRALFGIVAVFAQLRIDTIRENTRRGLANARANGRVGGRPLALTPAQIEAARALRETGHSNAAIGRALGVHRTTIMRALNRRPE